MSTFVQIRPFTIVELFQKYITHSFAIMLNTTSGLTEGNTAPFIYSSLIVLHQI